MTTEEKNTWVYAGLAVIIPIVYAVIVFSQLATVPASEVAYVVPLISAIGAAIVLAIVGSIAIGANRRDERDAHITRRGELVGYYVLSAGIIGVLALVVTGQPSFWIANSIYAAFVVSAIASSAVKLVAYRRGF